MPRQKNLDSVLERAATWPEEAQYELARVADEIEAELGSGAYVATEDEMRGIDRGLRDADEGRFVTDADLDAVFFKHRRQ